MPERSVLDDLGIAIHGQSFATRAVTEDLSRGYPQGDPGLFNIGLLHTALGGRPGHESYAPCTVDGLCSKGYQYWALGHVHQHEVVREDPWIVFPGNTQGRHIRESGAKGCVLVELEDGAVRNLSHFALDVMRWSLCTVDVTRSETVDQVYEAVREAFEAELDSAGERLVAVRLVFEGASPVHARLHRESGYWLQEFRSLAAGFGGSGIWLEKMALHTRPAASADGIFARDDALSGLLRAVRDLKLDQAALSDLAGEVSMLRQKLPPELLVGQDPFDPSEPGTLGEALEDVKEMLVSRLLNPEEN